jgi:hypothetical protein
MATKTPRSSAKKFGIKALPPDDPLYSMGYVVGQTFGPASPMRQARRAARTASFEVHPRIFWLRAWHPARRQGTVKILQSAVLRGGGTPYLLNTTEIIFGFPGLPEGKALPAARSVARDCRGNISGSDITLSASTIAPERFRPLLTEPWLHIGREELMEALTAGVRFNPVP